MWTYLATPAMLPSTSTASGCGTFTSIQVHDCMEEFFEICGSPFQTHA
jgi:hypothetical protein